MSEIADNYARVMARVARAAARADRAADEITLVAVTKTWPVSVLQAAYAAGLRHFGENRAEELVQKARFFAEELGTDNDIVWHQIGTLQSRKTRLVADYADYFHALDRLKIANRLNKRILENGRSPLPVLLELNVSGEASKAGFQAESWMSDATTRAELRKVVETVQQLPGLALQGVMTMAPWGAPEAEIRTVFAQTRAVAAQLQTAVPTATLTELSMGMTDDFELAIAAGATMIRVGRAIFGSRR